MDSAKVKALMITLGLWLIAAPKTFGLVEISLTISHYAVGIAVIALGLISFFTRKKVFPFILIGVGLYLSFSPLLFWTKSSFAYVNASLVGFIIMALAFEFPRMLGKDLSQQGDLPHGWTISPSSYYSRIITISLALVCWFLSRYLSAYQLGFISSVWDPFFPSAETEKVLSSSVAKFFPVSDAGLGALCYSLEVLLGFQGGKQRWKAMPWLVLLFGLLIVPAGIVSIVLIILQPVIVGAYCGICLVIAACMLIMVLLTLPELVAVLQLLSQRKKYNLSFFALLAGGLKGVSSSSKDSKRLGITPTWSLLLTTALGIWVFLIPYISGASNGEATVNFIAGPLIITLSILSFAEVARPLRLLNIPVALWLLLAPWMQEGGLISLMHMDSLIAILVIIFSLPRGKMRDRYGRLDLFLI